MLDAAEATWLLASVAALTDNQLGAALGVKLQADAGLHTFTRSHLDTARFDYNLALSAAEQLH